MRTEQEEQETRQAVTCLQLYLSWRPIICLAGCEFPAAVELFHSRDMWRAGMTVLNHLLVLLIPKTPR